MNYVNINKLTIILTINNNRVNYQITMNYPFTMQARYSTSQLICQVIFIFPIKINEVFFQIASKRSSISVTTRS